jgi:hypothetical protein
MGNMVIDGPCEQAVEAYVRTMTSWVSKSEGGDRKIRIVDAAFKAGAGERRGMVQPHTPCEVLVTFECDSPIPPFNVGFILRRTQDMYYCYAATTQELGHPLFELGAGERLTVRFYFNAHLTRGHYRVDLSVRDPNGAGFLLQSDGVASFTINEQITSHGLANVELKASVQRSQYSQSKIGKVG